MTGLFGAVAICAVLALAWLGRTLRWEVVDDDDAELGKGRGRPGSLQAWLRRHTWFGAKPRLLTYRRDHLGRFRRYRR